MTKGHALGLAGVAVLATAGGAGWLASVVYRPAPPPLAGVPESEVVDRIGGRGSYEPEFPRPALGEEFLVFLRKFPEVNGFRHLCGRAAFRVVDGELQSMGQMHREVTGQKVRDVLQELRGRAGHPGGWPPALAGSPLLVPST